MNNKLIIPADKYEEQLTQWLVLQISSSETEGRKELAFLLRISKAQMFERGRGDEYPFVDDIRPTTEDYAMIEENGWMDSENAEIKAYCLDLCVKNRKDKRQMKRAASDAYYELYNKTHHSPWFLVRAVAARYYVNGQDEEFIQKVCRAVGEVHGNWQEKIAKGLVKNCKSDLSPYARALEDRINAYVSSHDFHAARAVLDALICLKTMSSETYHARKAKLFEDEYDYLVETQKENEYKMKVDQIQEAYREICKVKTTQQEAHDRIRRKMIAEQKLFSELMPIFGAKVRYEVPDSLVEKVDKHLEEDPMDSPEKLIAALGTMKFPMPSHVSKLGKALVEAHPMLYMSFGASVATGEVGQTIGRAGPEDSLKIEAHRHLRVRNQYVSKRFVADFLEKEVDFDENDLGQGIIDGIKASYVEESRKVLWAKGIVMGCKGDMICAAHLLMPQIERALVKKAQDCCGDLTNYERDRHDQIGIDKALSALKPFLKGVLYDELNFFLINGADVNFRNRLAHGIMDPFSIIREGCYLWWLAIKMAFCENELFKKK